MDDGTAYSGEVLNSYANEQQLININGVDVTLDTSNLIGSQASTSTNSDLGISTRDNLLNSNWYTTTLKWVSDGNVGESGKMWTSPWSEGSEFCHPHLYNNSKDGNYVPNQPCSEILGSSKKVDVVIEDVDVSDKDSNIFVDLTINNKSNNKIDNFIEVSQKSLFKNKEICKKI